MVCVGWGVGGDGVVFQAEEKYVQRFLDLRSHVGSAAKSLEQREQGGEKRHLWIPLCGSIA